jgi:hypothetical protein
MHRVTLLLACLFLACTQILTAQSASSGPRFDTDPRAIRAASEHESLDAALFSDAEAQTFFIDFESLDVNVNYVIVKDPEGRIVWKDRVFNLPVDTIYEIDCSSFRPGIYQVELQTFTSALSQTIEVSR